MIFKLFPHSSHEEGVTMKDYLPEDVLEILHPVWHSYPPMHPLLTSVLGLLYCIMGKQLSFSSN